MMHTFRSNPSNQRIFGLINFEKSNVMIFNMKEQPEYLGNIKGVQKVKYIGIEIDKKRNDFKHKQKKIKFTSLKML